MEDRVENPRPAPAYEAVVQRLVRPIGLRRVFPLKAVPSDRDDPADHPHIIHLRNAVGDRAMQFDPVQPLPGQQKHLTHGHLQPE